MRTKTNLESLSMPKAAFERLKATIAIVPSMVNARATITLVISIISCIENAKSNIDNLLELAADIGDITLQLVEEDWKETGSGGLALKEAFTKFDAVLTDILGKLFEMREPRKGWTLRRSGKPVSQQVLNLKRLLDDGVAALRTQDTVFLRYQTATVAGNQSRLRFLSEKADELAMKLRPSTNTVNAKKIDRLLDESQTSEIWRQALSAYQTLTGFDSEDDSGCRDADDIVRRWVIGTKGEAEPCPKKTEALRNVIAAILSLAQRGSATLKDIACPTSPVSSAIAAALKFLVKASQNDAHEYDVVIASLKKVHSFMAKFDATRQNANLPCLNEVVIKFFAQVLKMLGVVTRRMVVSGLRETNTSLESLLSDSDVKEGLDELERLKEFYTAGARTSMVPADMSQKRDASEGDGDLESMLRCLVAPMPFRSRLKYLAEQYETTGSWFLCGKQYLAWKRTQHSLFWLQGHSGTGKSVLASAIVKSLEDEVESDPSSALAYFYCDFSDSETLRCGSIVSSLVAQLLCRCPTLPSALVSVHANYTENKRSPTSKSLVLMLHDILKYFRDVYIVLDGLDECTYFHENGRNAVLSLVRGLAEAELPSLHLLISSREEIDIREALHHFDPEVCKLVASNVDSDIQTYLRGMLAEDPYFQPLTCDLKTDIQTALLKKGQGVFRWITCQVRNLKTCQSPSEIRRALNELPEGLAETYARYLRDVPTTQSSYVRKLLTFLAFSTRAMTLEELSEIEAVRIDLNHTPCFSQERVPLNLKSILTICSGLITTVHGSECPSESSFREEQQETVFVRLAHISVKEYLLSPSLQQEADIGRFSLLRESSHSLITRICLNYLLQLNNDDLLDPLLEADCGSGDQTFRDQVADTGKDEHSASSNSLPPDTWHIVSGPGHQGMRVWNTKGGDEVSRPVEEPTASAGSSAFLPDTLHIVSGSDYQMIRIWDAKTGKEVSRPFDGHTKSVRSVAFSPDFLHIVSGSDVKKIRVWDKYMGQGTCKPIEIRKGPGTSTELTSASLDIVPQPDRNIRVWVNKTMEGDRGLSAHALASYAAMNWIIHLRSSAADERVFHTELSRLFRPDGVPFRNWIRIYHRLWKIDEVVGEPLSPCCLYHASEFGLCETVRLLLARGYDVNAPTVHEVSALQIAATQGHHTIAQLLLQSGADVNAEGGMHGTALQAASHFGHDKVASLLLQSGADVNAQSGRFGTALQAASASGHDTIVRLLLKRGALVDAAGGEYGSALLAASSCGHEGVVHLLLEHGANMGTEEWQRGTALEMAAGNGHEAVVRLLLDYGADIDASGGEHGTPLQAASCSGHIDVVRLLLESGADVNRVAGEFGTALQAASRWSHEEVVRLLLENGSDVNAQGGAYGTALQAASHFGHKRVIEVLLQHGADVNSRTGWYSTALSAASRWASEDVVHLLLESGADVNAKGGRYGTPLYAASIQGRDTIVHLLLNSGADVNAVGGQYGTALDAASYSGHETVVSLLVENGARQEYRDYPDNDSV